MREKLFNKNNNNKYLIYKSLIFHTSKVNYYQVTKLISN